MTTTDVAQAVVAITRGPLPPPVDAWSRHALVDTLAVLVAGTETPLAEAARRAAVAHPGDRAVPATDLRTSAQWAALCGATAASALDLDDGHYRGGGVHAGSTVLPVLLAGADPATPLPDLRRALVAGYEVAIRVGHLVSPAASGQPYRASGYSSAVGAAAALTALGALRGGARDPVAEVASAIRLACASAPASMMTSTAARESIGWAAATAVSVAELVAAGAAVPAEDGELVPPAGPTWFDGAADPYVATLGATFEAVDTYTKPYPCCRAAHAMLDALAALRPSLGGARVRSVRVTTVPGAAGLTERRPTGLAQAQYSLPFLAAVLLVHGDSAVSGLDHTSVPSLAADPRVRAVADRVHVEGDPVLGGPPGWEYPARVRVEADGEIVAETSVEHARGGPTVPLADHEVAARRRALLRRVLPPERAEEVVERVVTDRGTVADLAPVLAEPTAGARVSLAAGSADTWRPRVEADRDLAADRAATHALTPYSSTGGATWW